MKPYDDKNNPFAQYIVNKAEINNVVIVCLTAALALVCGLIWMLVR